MAADTAREVIFWILAVVMGLTALRVVTSRNVVHAALYLAGTMMGAAALYALLLAEFVAWAQVLIYVGAIIVLMLFGIMLTKAQIGRANFDNDQRLLAAIVAAVLFGVTSWILIDGFSGQELDLSSGVGASTRSIGEVIFSSYVLPFEIVSVLLLAALVGAILIARKDDPGDGDR